MREIKFRAWDKGTALHAPRMISFEEALEVQTLTTFFGDKKSDRYEVLLFTGLFDKNGVEIFEGDIVICPNDEKYKIKWHKRMCCFVGYMIDGDYEMFDYVLKETLLKVIGNIYENKELLND